MRILDSSEQNDVSGGWLWGAIKNVFKPSAVADGTLDGSGGSNQDVRDPRGNNQTGSGSPRNQTSGNSAGGS